MPLHWALARGHPERVIHAVLEAHPDAARQPDVAGRCPLHWALECRYPESVVHAVLEAHPDAARKRDWHGSFPLHFALDHQHPEKVIHTISEAHRDAAEDLFELASVVAPIGRESRSGLAPTYSNGRVPLLIRAGITTLGRLDVEAMGLQFSRGAFGIERTPEERLLRAWHRGGA